MAVIYVLLGISVLVASVFLIVFLWSLFSGQYDDDYTPAVRMLFEDTPKEKPKKQADFKEF